MGTGRWAGIPLTDTVLSTEQARMIGTFSSTDKVIVVVPNDERAQKLATDCMAELPRIFRRVEAIELPPGMTSTTLWLTHGGHQRLHDGLLATRPLSDYLPRRGRPRRRQIRTNSIEPDPQAGLAPDL